MQGRKGVHTDSARARRAGADTEAADAAERPANPIDRYSLALQLIQVFPVVSGLAFALVTVTWLARVLAAAGLLLGTAWVVLRERVRGKDAQRDAEVQRADVAAAVVEALLNGPVATGEYGGEYRGVSISIRIDGPASSAYRHRYRQRRLRELRSRPALPPPPRAPLFRHEIRGQSEMILRIVDDESPDVH